jgi:hypothetical protein
MAVAVAKAAATAEATTKASTELLGYDKLWKRIESFY